MEPKKHTNYTNSLLDLMTSIEGALSYTSKICQQPPLGNYFKLNIDGALFFDSQEAGIGVILRDCKNEILMAASIKEMTLFQLEIIECLAICRGLQQCILLGISHLVVESDCLSVVHQIQGAEEAYLPLGNIINEIWHLMSDFQNCIVQHRHRTSNEAAHCLVRNACHVQDIVLWFGDTPEFLTSTTWLDKRKCMVIDSI